MVISANFEANRRTANQGRGDELFALACQRDLEGIVAKRKLDPYLLSAPWLKIRNRKYSQWEGREELFEWERHQEPAAP